MAKRIRSFIAVNEETGERKEYETQLAFAKEHGTSVTNVSLALGRNGSCMGWKLYPTPKELRIRIAQLQRLLSEVEDL